MNLQDKKVLILGLGESGLAMARWCGREGASVRVADTRADPPGRAMLQQAMPAAEVRCGGPDVFDTALLEGIDLLAISPGLAPRLEPQAALLAESERRGIPVWGEIEFFARKLEQLRQDTSYAPKLIAITGTNGKTTVTSLAGKMCMRAGMSTMVAGNISPAALDALTDAIDRSALPQVWVLELSSFQLETTHSLHADAATVLNVTQDHLDWHGDMDAYANAKARIFSSETVRVLNRDDARVCKMADELAPCMTFGVAAPQAAWDFGIVREGGMQWLACMESAEIDGDGPGGGLAAHVAGKSMGKGAGMGRRRRKAAVEEPPHLVRLMPVEALRIRGRHNAANALAALALCRAIGLPSAPLLHALRDYRGETHRVETVMSIDGVEYIDDSKGTNVGATVAALEGLAGESGVATSGTDDSARLILIAGGDGKGQDFTPLADPVARCARAVMLIGKDAPTLRAALADTGVELVDCATLEEAVHRAAALAQPGDKVLLSPACASLDMFRDYRHRAEVFVKAVAALRIPSDVAIPVPDAATGSDHHTHHAEQPCC